jgi:predicted hotdog family 3-hydroxylacyl-ACP dehydratase
MCLLDRVTRWDETRIVCCAEPPAADHPFAQAEGVPPIVAVEYAAQAAAVHGALLAGHREPRDGMLATLSEVELSQGWLDDSSGALTIDAELLARDASGCMYSFMVHDEHGCRARGRLVVAFTDERSVRTPGGGLTPHLPGRRGVRRAPR